MCRVHVRFLYYGSGAVFILYAEEKYSFSCSFCLLLDK